MTITRRTLAPADHPAGQSHLNNVTITSSTSSMPSQTIGFSSGWIGASGHPASIRRRRMALGDRSTPHGRMTTAYPSGRRAGAACRVFRTRTHPCETSWPGSVGLGGAVDRRIPRRVGSPRTPSAGTRINPARTFRTGRQPPRPDAPTRRTIPRWWAWSRLRRRRRTARPDARRASGGAGAPKGRRRCDRAAGVAQTLPAGTQPSVPLGATPRRTRSHTAPPASRSRSTTGNASRSPHGLVTGTRREVVRTDGPENARSRSSCGLTTMGPGGNEGWMSRPASGVGSCGTRTAGAAVTVLTTTPAAASRSATAGAEMTTAPRSAPIKGFHRICRFNQRRRARVELEKARGAARGGPGLDSPSRESGGMADALGLGPSARKGRGGSTPPSRTAPDLRRCGPMPLTLPSKTPPFANIC